MFKVITNYCNKDKYPYKLGFYNKAGKWVQVSSFLDIERAFEVARNLNGVDASPRCTAEMARTIRKQFY